MSDPISAEQLQALFPGASKSLREANNTPDNRAEKAVAAFKSFDRYELERDTNYATDSQISNTKPKRNKTAALDGAIQGEAESLRRTRIRFTGYRVRPLDPDNFAGGCKDLLDGLRHAALIPGDEPWKIIYETEQVKVKKFEQEKTVIEIYSLEELISKL